MMTQAALREALKRLDGQSYKAYKSIKGEYDFDEFTLQIDYVQGDPFAAPSQVRVFVPQSIAQFPTELFKTPSRTIALEDYLTRQFDQAANPFKQHRGSGKSGLIATTRPGQAILPRTTAFVDEDRVELRFVVGLPAFGRRIAGYQAVDLLCDDVPEIVMRSLLYANLDSKAIRQ